MFNLKLRAWYKPEQIMCEVHGCNYCDYKDGSFGYFELVEYRLLSDHIMKRYHSICRAEIDLMVSLGVKDKNQQILFNKDIVKCDFTDYAEISVSSSDDYSTITHYGVVNLKVNLYDNGFYITNLVHGDYPNAPFYDEMGQNFVWNELEKIGNVYETVLLKCSHCDNIDFINCPDIVGPCSVCGEQNLINIDLLKYKEVIS